VTNHVLLSPYANAETRLESYCVYLSAIINTFGQFDKKNLRVFHKGLLYNTMFNTYLYDLLKLNIEMVITIKVF